MVLKFDPPGVEIDPDLYETEIKPPIYQRWEKYWKPNSRRAKRQFATECRLLVRQIPKVWT